MDYSKITEIELDDIVPGDAPDFCDAYIIDANYDGRPMTEDELEEINEDRNFVYWQVLEQLY